MQLSIRNLKYLKLYTNEIDMTKKRTLVFKLDHNTNKYE